MIEIGHTIIISFPILLKHWCSSDSGVFIVTGGYDYVIHSSSRVLQTHLSKYRSTDNIQYAREGIQQLE
jgi:hypothetical protein